MDPNTAPSIPGYNPFYHLMRVLLLILSKLYFRLEVVGIENLPAKGGVLLVANHASNLDPTTVACGLNRQVHFLAKEELFRGLLGKFLRRLNANPLKRSGVDRKALRQCREILMQGHVLLVFPEGQRTTTGELLDLKPGAALFAAQTDVPIVPVYIAGSGEAMPPGAKRICPRKITVRIGKPFRFDHRDVLSMRQKDFYKTACDIMLNKIRELGKSAYRNPLGP